MVLTTDVSEPLLLHWGVARDEPNQWLLPPEHLWPDGSVAATPTARPAPKPPLQAGSSSRLAG